MRPRWPRPTARPPAPRDVPQAPHAHPVWRVEKGVAAFRGSTDRVDAPRPRGRGDSGEPPSPGEELEQLTHEYRRLQNEHRRSHPQSHTRRRLEARLARLRERLSKLSHEDGEGVPAGAESTVEPSIRVRGDVGPDARADLARTLERVARLPRDPVLRITGSITRHRDPAVERPFAVNAEIDLGRRVVRGHAAAASVRDAIDELEALLRRNVREG